MCDRAKLHIGGPSGRTVRLVRRSSRIAFVFAWAVYALAVYFAWQKVLAVPDGRGDVTGLSVATVAGATGLALLGAWLQEHERGR
jgi:hypothetical protein